VIQIIGQNRVLNELLCHYLENAMQLKCCLSSDTIYTAGEQVARPQYRLTLIDSSTFLLGCHGETIKAGCENSSLKPKYALFNVDPASGLEGEAMRIGVRGVFYAKDSLELVCKGIDKVLKGEIWYSREAMMDCILQGPQNNGLVSSSKPELEEPLTFREQRILRQLVKGTSNQEIADELLISIHTVKSHLYSLYKKINVANRFQAAYWAANNID